MGGGMKRTKEREQFLGDIITTAVEGGTGYWAQVSQYQWIDDFSTDETERGVVACVGKRVGDEPRAVLHELNDEGYGYREEGLVLDLDAVARGLRGLIDYYEKAWAKRVAEGRTQRTGLSDAIRLLKLADRENDAGYIDADYADTIAQMALLGEIRYG